MQSEFLVINQAWLRCTYKLKQYELLIRDSIAHIRSLEQAPRFVFQECHTQIQLDFAVREAEGRMQLATEIYAFYSELLNLPGSWHHGLCLGEMALQQKELKLIGEEKLIL